MRTCVWNDRFPENLACFVFLWPCFEICLFTLLTMNMPLENCFNYLLQWLMQLLLENVGKYWSKKKIFTQKRLSAPIIFIFKKHLTTVRLWFSIDQVYSLKISSMKKILMKYTEFTVKVLCMFNSSFVFTFYIACLNLNGLSG